MGRRLPSPIGPSIEEGALLAWTSTFDGSERLYRIEVIKPVESRLWRIDGGCAPITMPTREVVDLLMDSRLRPCSRALA